MIARIGTLFFFSVVASVWAQEVIGTTSQSVTELTADSTPAPLSPTLDSNLHSEIRDQVSDEPRRFQYGLQITVRGVYDDNINITQTNRVSDYYFTIEPVLTLGAGNINSREDNYLRLDYAPSLFVFAEHSNDTAIQQVIHVEGQHHFARLTVSLGEDIAILDGTDLRGLLDVTTPGSHPNLDVSGRTKFETYATRLNASYDLSGKTFVSTGFNALMTEYNSSSLFSSANISENVFLNYRYSDKVVIGVGGSGGYDFVDAPNPNQSFEQVNVRASYQVTGKLSLNVSGGVEFRQFENSSRGQYISPVFDLGANYQLSDSTTFTLSGNRRTFNSGVLAGQDLTATTLDASIRQRFLQRFYFGVSGGYQNSDYFSTIGGVSSNRQDNYYFIEPSLDFSITRFWTVGGYYLHRQNDSSFQTFTFDDNQIGIRAALIF